MDNPFRHEWSIRLARLRLRSLPRDWELLRKRLADAFTQQIGVARTTARHEHYCEDCDRAWLHEGHVCPVAWAFPCAGHRNGASPGRVRLARWFIVVRRDRSELCQQLTETFGDDPRITVILDRRQLARRGPADPSGLFGRERRRGSDGRTPPTDRDGLVWASLGFRPHRVRSHGPL